MTRRVSGWLAHALAWTLLVTGMAVLYLRHQDREDAEPAKATTSTYATMPFASTLSLQGADRGRVGSAFQFAAEGFSAVGVASVTLYDGARAVDTVVPDGTGQVPLVLPALSVGRHTVHAAVTDKDGKVSDTAPVQVLVGVAPGREDVPVEVPVLPGETPTDVSERLGVPVENLLTGARKIDPKVPLPTGVRVVAVVPPDAGIDLLRGESPVVTAGHDPGPLTLTAQEHPCGVELTAEGADGKVTFFRGSGGTGGWVQIGRPQGDGKTTIDGLTPGQHVFFARADQGAGYVTSGQVSVIFPDNCGDDDGWTGTASIEDGDLIIPKDAPGAFVLLSVNGTTWHRVPASQDEFFYAHQRTSLAHLLPSLAGNRLQLQVFSVTNDIGPMQVASGELRVPTDRTIASYIGEPSAVSLTVDTKSGPASGITLESTDKTLDFTWNGASKATTRVRWQVLTTRTTASDLSLNPPGLLASGVSEASDTGNLGDRSGTFSIDTASIPRADREAPGVKGSGTAVALRPPAIGGVLNTEPAYASIVPVSDLTEAAAPVDLPVEGSTVFVRVVPETGPAAASPSVFVSLPAHQSVKKGVDFNVNTVKVDAGRAANPKFAGCAQVEVPWGKFLPPDPFTSGDGVGTAEEFDRYYAGHHYPQSGLYCPGDWPPPEECDEWYCEVGEFLYDAAGVLIGFVVEVYSIVSHVYNGLIDGVVNVLTELNPICAALGAGGEGKAAKSCKTVTGFATKAAISAVLTTVGLPPSLPSIEELEAIASGELDALAVELMKGLGVPCDAVTPPDGFDDALAVAGEKLNAPVLSAAADPCLAVAHLLIANVRKAAVASAQQGLAASSGMPDFPDIEGLTMKADPRGLSDPMKVEVSITVRDVDADTTGLDCSAVAYRPATAGGPGYGLQSIGPYGFFRFTLSPTNATGRTFKGTGVRYPIDGGVVAEGAQFPVTVGPNQPTGCRFATTVETGTVRAPDQ